MPTGTAAADFSNAQEGGSPSEAGAQQRTRAREVEKTAGKLATTISPQEEAQPTGCAEGKGRWMETEGDRGGLEAGGGEYLGLAEEGELGE